MVRLTYSWWILGFAMTFAGGLHADESDLAGRLGKIVQAQAVQWNGGDIDGFMQAYWQSEQLTFSSGGRTMRGWETTRKRYHARYPSRERMGKLTFFDLETQTLSSKSALMLGRWKLERKDPVEGNFSLVWRQFPHGWRIVHDHTSTLEPK